jgi:hypothetical protein
MIMRNALELLNNAEIASPCYAKWDDMTGDDQSRFCNHCDKHVFNLSALTAEAALQLIREKEGNLCGRFYRRADGTILTADCPVGVHHRIRRKRRMALVGSSLAALLSFSGCARFDDTESVSTTNPPAKQEKPPLGPPVFQKNFEMGKICIPGDFARGEAPPQVGSETLPPPREAAGNVPAPE